MCFVLASICCPADNRDGTLRAATKMDGLFEFNLAMGMNEEVTGMLDWAIHATRDAGFTWSRLLRGSHRYVSSISNRRWLLMRTTSVGLQHRSSVAREDLGLPLEGHFRCKVGMGVSSPGIPS